MSKRREAEEIIASLSRAEKAQVLKLVVRDLADAFPGIDSAPDSCGGEARVARSRIPVWVLEQAKRLGASEAQLLGMYPTLRAEDVANVWAFVRTHRDEIEADIVANEGA